MKPIAPVLLLAWLLAAPASAAPPAPVAPPAPKAPADPTSPSATPAATPSPSAFPLWRCTLPGGSYEVAVRAMTAVSSHEYVIDGGVRVTEVNIATSGSLLARFYYLEPNTGIAPTGLGAATLDKAQSLLTEGLNRTGVDAWQKVVKSYPTSTHAHTAEYRLDSKDALAALYTSAETAFRLQKAGQYSGE